MSKKQNVCWGQSKNEERRVRWAKNRQKDLKGVKDRQTKTKKNVDGSEILTV